jgi:hypothetical protein
MAKAFLRAMQIVEPSKPPRVDQVFVDYLDGARERYTVSPLCAGNATVHVLLSMGEGYNVVLVKTHDGEEFLAQLAGPVHLVKRQKTALKRLKKRAGR